MKNARILVGLLGLIAFLSFSSCEKEDETTTEDETASSIRYGEVYDDVESTDMKPRDKMHKKHKAMFFAQLSEDELATLETYKTTLESVNELRKAHFESLSADVQEQLKSHQMTKEEHQAMRAAFETTLSADQLEALAYMKSLKEKYKPAGGHKHPKGE